MKILKNKPIEMFNYIELENKENYIALGNTAIMKVENYKQAKEHVQKKTWELTCALIGTLIGKVNEEIYNLNRKEK